MKKWATRSIGFALACLLKIGCNTADAADGADAAVQTLALAARGLPSTYRIAYTADGNTNDPDDIGATPLALAIFAAFGVQDRVVHVSYNGILGTNNPTMHDRHVASVNGAISRFGYNKNITKVYNAYSNTTRAVNNLRDVINASSANNRLFLIIAGPCEVPYRAINAAASSKRQHVTVISHSWWNNYYDVFVGDDPVHQNKGMPHLVPIVGNWLQIRDQNSNLCVSSGGGCGGGTQVPESDSSWNPYRFLKNSSDPNLQWLWHRLLLVGRPDPSDAGMAYFLMTGIDNVYPDDSSTWPSAWSPPSVNNTNEQYTLKRLLEDHIVPAATNRKVLLMQPETWDLTNYSVYFDQRLRTSTSHRSAVESTLGGGTVAWVSKIWNEIGSQDGTYTISTRYFDEPGNSTFRLIVNGKQRDFWTASANDNTWKNRIKTGVTIRIGYEVVVEAIANSSERIRLDAITFTRTGSAAAGQ
jgi:hypothetical protein